MIFFISIIVAFLLRLAPLGRYVTPDEPAWVYRSVRFVEALAGRDWQAVPSTGHPGVTTMWLGAAGVTVSRLLAPAESAAYLDWLSHPAWLSPTSDETLRRLAFFLPWGRAAVALATTLGLAALYPLLARFLDRRVALLAVGLLACDPFLVGHSGLLHTDALLATFTLLALTAALNGLREPRRAVWWLLSGPFTGLAVLTKTPAIALLPFIGLAQFIAHLRKPPISNLQSLAWHLLLFALAAAITCFILYPALWIDPAGTFDTLFAFAERHVETTLRPVFFAGQMTYDSGPAYYPVALVVRASPITLAGLVVGLIALRRLPADRRFAFLLLLAFAVGFGTLMSLGAKKHDRYILPALTPLAVAAAIGLEYMRKRGASRRGGPASAVSSSALLLVLQLLIALAFVPHPLTYANPLLGGPWVASRLLWLDWGEGAGAAARWLNRQPDAAHLAVATDAVPIVAPIFEGHTVSLDHISLADYVVLPIDPPTHQPANQTANLPTTYVARIGPLDHAAVYTNTAPFQQSAYLAANAAPGDLILLDADTPLLHRYTGPGTVVSVADLPTQTAVAERVAALTADLSAGRLRIWLVADPAASPITTDHVRCSVEAIAAPLSTATIASATITQYAVRDTSISELQSPTSTFAHQIVLIDALVPHEAVTDRFSVSLRWQVPGPTPTGLQVLLYLRDPAGHLWAETGQPILDGNTFPTSAWAPGQWADDRLAVKLPERIPPSTYAIQVAVADGAGAQLGAWDADGTFRGVRVPVGEVTVAPPARPAGPADCTEHPLYIVGPFLACVVEPPPQTIPSGDAFALTIAWSATTPPEGDYTVRWRLLDSGGSAILEQTDALSPYPSSRWRADDSFESRYDLRIEPTLPAVAYTLAFNILDPGGNPLWARDEVLGTVEVSHRERRFELPDDIAYPLNLTLGDSIHLRGFDLDITEATPGDTLPLTLYWQGSGPTDIDYTVFVHLVGPDGQAHGQLDYFPGGGAAPTTSWAPGQVVIDELTLPIAADAPAGTYHIAVGLYDATSGGRLPVIDTSGQRLPDDHAILPADITVAGGSR